MYSEKNIIHIFTILECCEKCWIYSSKYDNPKDFIFENEQCDFNATLMMFTAIGEESKKIDENLKNSVHTNINWKDVAGIRDKISHDYRGIDEKILWNTIQNELHLLKESVLEMLQFVKVPQEMLEEMLDSPYYKHLQYLKK